MYLTLDIARDFVGAAVPDNFFYALPLPQDLAGLRRLVEEQIWSARSGTESGARLLTRLLAENSWRKRASLVWTRLQLLDRRDLGPKLGFADLVNAVRIVSRRLFVLFRTRVPRYVRAWRRGQLKKAAIQGNVRLMRCSDTMFRLITEQEQRARANASK